MNKAWLTIRMTPKEYASFIGHSEAYVRKYVMRNENDTMIQLRIPTSSVMEDIYDIRGVKSD